MTQIAASLHILVYRDDSKEVDIHKRLIATCKLVTCSVSEVYQEEENDVISVI